MKHVISGRLPAFLTVMMVTGLPLSVLAQPATLTAPKAVVKTTTLEMPAIVKLGPAMLEELVQTNQGPIYRELPPAQPQAVRATDSKTAMPPQNGKV